MRQIFANIFNKIDARQWDTNAANSWGVTCEVILSGVFQLRYLNRYTYQPDLWK